VQLVLLTGCRNKEIRAASWRELDLGKRELFLKGDRTKNHEDHLVPLSSPAMELINGLPRIAGKAELLYDHGRNADFRPYSNSVLPELVERYGAALDLLYRGAASKICAIDEFGVWHPELEKPADIAHPMFVLSRRLIDLFERSRQLRPLSPLDIKSSPRKWLTAKERATLAEAATILAELFERPTADVSPCRFTSVSTRMKARSDSFCASMASPSIRAPLRRSTVRTLHALRS